MDGDEGCIAGHLADLRWRNYSPGTVAQRRYALARLGRFLAPKMIVAATTPELIDFLSRLTNAPSKIAERSHLAGFYRWMMLEGHREDDPTLRVPRPKGKRWMPHPMSEDDVTRALRGAPDRIRPWLYLAAFAGLRAKEIANLRGEDIWWHADPPLIVVTESKGGDPSAVPLAPILEPFLRALPRKGRLFTKVDGAPLPPHVVSHYSNNYLHSIDIAHTLHSLRHRFGTQVYRASGRDLRQTQELMRHRSIASTTIYTMVTQDEAAGILRALPSA